MNIDDATFLEHFESMSSIGATPNSGVERQAGSPADGQTRQWFRGLMEALGFQVRQDSIGNQFALLEFDPSLPWVGVGSHLDSQPRGGRFDGAYGVLAGAHAAARLRKQTDSKFNIAVINWFNEEGGRFPPSMMGSSVFTKKLRVEDALRVKDATGVSVGDALASMSATGDFALELAAYVEVHIEQGRRLEAAGIQIGIVDSTWGAEKFTCQVRGDQGHTAATMLEDRHDALFGGALVVAAAREVAEQFSDEQATVNSACGEFHVSPNSPVVVPSQVDLRVDFRSADKERLTRAVAEFRKRVDEAAARAKVEIELTPEHSWPAQEYDAAGIELAKSAADSLGLSHTVLKTLSGHDSTNLKDVAPTVFLFVPSVEGISHNERELTNDNDMLAGVAMVTEVLRRILNGEYV